MSESAVDQSEPCGFAPIWEVIKGWDIGKDYPPETWGDLVARFGGKRYAGATGDDVRAILAALNAAGLQVLPRLSAVWCRTCGVHHQPGKHVRREAAQPPIDRAEYKAAIKEAVDEVLRERSALLCNGLQVSPDGRVGTVPADTGFVVSDGTAVESRRLVSGAFAGIDGRIYAFSDRGVEAPAEETNTYVRVRLGDEMDRPPGLPLGTEVHWHEPHEVPIGAAALKASVVLEGTVGISTTAWAPVNPREHAIATDHIGATESQTSGSFLRGWPGGMAQAREAGWRITKVDVRAVLVDCEANGMPHDNHPAVFDEGKHGIPGYRCKRCGKETRLT